MSVYSLGQYNVLENSAPPNEIFIASLASYTSLLHEQNQILEDREDLAVLRSGLKQLPNLKRILILDQFGSSQDFQPYFYDHYNFEWYKDWSKELCKGIAHPTRWYQANVMDSGVHTGDSPWDFRGVKNLLDAVEECVPQLRELYMGSQVSNLTPDIYSLEEHNTILCRIAPRLITLKMDCYYMRFGPESQPDDYIEALQRILQETKNLQSLSLSMPSFKADMSKIFPKTKWSHLRVLELGDGLFGSDFLMALVNAHAETLRELRLRNVSLEDEISLEEVAAKLGQSLQLHMVSLLSMADITALETTGEPYLDDSRHEKAALLFMQRVPDHLLELKTSEGMAIAWNKQDFIPAYNLERVYED
ncbi:MAG: hypothetical protein Q9201_000196 [Fulgogasparrea decipioides]